MKNQSKATDGGRNRGMPTGQSVDELYDARLLNQIEGDVQSYFEQGPNLEYQANQLYGSNSTLKHRNDPPTRHPSDSTTKQTQHRPNISPAAANLPHPDPSPSGSNPAHTLQPSSSNTHPLMPKYSSHPNRPLPENKGISPAKEYVLLDSAACLPGESIRMMVPSRVLAEGHTQHLQGDAGRSEDGRGGYLGRQGGDSVSRNKPPRSRGGSGSPVPT